MNTMPMPLLPLWSGFHSETIETTATRITLTAAGRCPSATCPDCAQPAQQVHSTYVRHLHDLPWSGLPVRVRLRVRRFFCRPPTCSRRTFVEQGVGLTRRHAQRTSSLNAALRHVGLALGGAAGARLAARLGYRGRASTILRRVRQGAVPPTSRPRVVGIDDWALCTGQRYGTVLVDLERHAVCDLLPEHTAEQITAWLPQHPGMDVIARDRTTLHAEALAPGAPQAQEVADRWHLLQNVTTVLQEIVGRHTATLRAVARALSASPDHPAHPEPAEASAPPPPPWPELALPEHIVGPVSLRQHQCAEAKRLHAAGGSLRRIAHERGSHRRTATRYVAADELPRRVLPQSTSRVRPYLDYVAARWAAGVQHGRPLHAELQAQGYRGSVSSVYGALTPWRSGDGRRQRREPAAPRDSVSVRSPRQATWLLLRTPGELSAEDAA